MSPPAASVESKDLPPAAPSPARHLAPLAGEHSALQVGNPASMATAWGPKPNEPTTGWHPRRQRWLTPEVPPFPLKVARHHLRLWMILALHGEASADHLRWRWTAASARVSSAATWAAHAAKGHCCGRLQCCCGTRGKALWRRRLGARDRPRSATSSMGPTKRAVRISRTAWLKSMMKVYR